MRNPELERFMRLTTSERRQALQALQATPPLLTLVPEIVTFTARPYRRRPRPGKEFRKLTNDDRTRLLGRESEQCGPGILLIRVKAIIEAKNAGDPRALAGTLDDLAAAAVSWSERTVSDMLKPPKLT